MLKRHKPKHLYHDRHRELQIGTKQASIYIVYLALFLSHIMQIIKSLIWSFIVVVVILFRRYVAAYSESKYKKFSDLSGVVCPDEYVISSHEVSSLIKCSLLCEVYPDCDGLDYNRDTKMCRLCKSLKGANCEYQSLTYTYVPGTKTFTKGKGYLVSGIAPIADENFDSSSHFISFTIDHSAIYSRYCKQEDLLGPGYAAWSSGLLNSDQWIQARFFHSAVVTAIYLLPRKMPAPYFDQYVTSYKLMFSSDCAAFDYYRENGAETVFPGIQDGTNPTTAVLPCPITAMCIRIQPITWVEYISLRFDAIGYYP